MISCSISERFISKGPLISKSAQTDYFIEPPQLKRVGLQVYKKVIREGTLRSEEEIFSSVVVKMAQRILLAVVLVASLASLAIAAKPSDWHLCGEILT